MKNTKIIKSSISVVLAVLMILSTVFVGTISTNAADALTNTSAVSAGTKVYFDNSVSKWSDVYFFGWYGSDNGTFHMTNISGTDIWYYQFNAEYTGQFIVKNTSTGWDLQTANLDYPDDGTNCAKPTSSANRPGITWYTYEDTPTTGKLNAGDSLYFKSTTKFSKVYLASASLDGVPTADVNVAMSALGDSQGYYYYSCNVSADTDTVSFHVVLADTTEADYSSKTVADNKNTYCPDDDTWSTYEVNKAAAFSSGVWVDTQPSVKNSAAGLVQWSNKKGQTTQSSYTLYIPGGVDMSTMPVYSSYSSLTINGTAVAQGGTYPFVSGTTYSMVCGSTTNSVKVIQSDSASIFTFTSTALDTTTHSDVIAKPSYKNGDFMTVSSDGQVYDKLQTLAQIKGRGNSSWEASSQIFGKYAYNIKVNSKINVLGMLDDDKSKSFCLLANNMDQAGLRNSSVFQMAEEAGLSYTPNYKTVDFYNNGNYLGTYLITEKVAVGSSALVKGETVEDYHTASQGGFSTANYTYNGGSYAYRYSTDIGSIAEGQNFKEKSYLLEFDLSDRAQAEDCWFVSPKGQYVALKEPADLNQEEMLYIINKFADAEKAAYSGDYQATSKLIDLESFAQVYLVQEFTKNLDSCATSYYVYFDGTQGENTKLKACPIWDYDWALGEYTYGSKKQINTSGSNATQDLTSTTGWFAKYKYMTHSGEDSVNNQYDFQANLANMSDFWNKDVKYVWNSKMYSAATNVYGTEISSMYDAVDQSLAMNEARWNFVATNPISSWGSKTTGTTPLATYQYLANWGVDRTTWMNNQLTANVTTIYIDPAEFDNPENLYAYAKDSSGSLIGDGTNMATLEKVTDQNDGHYGFYIARIVSTDSTFKFGVSTTLTTNDNFAGTKTDITARALGYHYSKAGVVTQVTEDCAHAPYADVSTDSAEVDTGTQVNVSYKVSRQLSYTITVASDSGLEPTDITDNLVFTPDVAGTYTVTISAKNKNGTTTKTQDVVVNDVTEPTTVAPTTVAPTTVPTEPTTVAPTTVPTEPTTVAPTTAPTEPTTVAPTTAPTEPTTTGEVISGVKVRFKGVTLTSCQPKLTFNGSTIDMDKGDYIGTYIYGSYKFYWYEATLPDVVSGQNYTLNIKGAKTSMNASITMNFTDCPEDKTYYLGVDNLLAGTEIVNITNNQTAKVAYKCAVNMITNVVLIEEYAQVNLSLSGASQPQAMLLGDVDTNDIINIKDVTATQFMLADGSDYSENDKLLADFDISGGVDINDATAMQQKIAG